MQYNCSQSTIFNTSHWYIAAKKIPGLLKMYAKRKVLRKFNFVLAEETSYKEAQSNQISYSSHTPGINSITKLLTSVRFCNCTCEARLEKKIELK